MTACCSNTVHIVHLHGHLATFGSTYRLAVNSPAEAAKALSLQIKGFSAALRKGYYRLVRGDSENGLHYGEQELHFSLGGSPTDFHFIPVLTGSGGGGGGAGKAILGAVIMIAAVVAAPFTGGTSLFGTSAFTFGAGAMGTVLSTAFAIGASVALMGVASMLQPALPSGQGMQQRERPEDRASFFLSGPVNMAEQGGALPVLYGSFCCGSHIINAGLEMEDIAPDGSTTMPQNTYPTCGSDGYSGAQAITHCMACPTRSCPYRKGSQ